MLQWLPDSGTEVIWNDREGDRFISHILNVRTGERRCLAHPIYALSARRALRRRHRLPQNPGDAAPVTVMP